MAWYERFLTEQLEDLSVNVSEWSDIPGAESSSSRVRNVSSYHPSKVSFPGLPSHAEVSISIRYTLTLCDHIA